MPSTNNVHNDLSKFLPRKPLVDPKLKGPQLFYDPTFKAKLYTLDAKAPIMKQDFEFLGGRRKSDNTYNI